MYNFLVNVEQINALVNSKVKTQRNQTLLTKRIHAAEVEINGMLKFRNLKENNNLRLHLDPIIDHMCAVLNDARQGIYDRERRS